MEKLFQQLGIEAFTKATASGLSSYNPATGEAIARIPTTTPTGYERTVEAAVAAFKEWRSVPAPKRGEVVRLIGEELRRHKDALGTLVSLETGKIKQEGDGEVQEMIDMADFAVDQSRMLYGNTMQSERPLHRMYEQWHPLGPVAVITAFNFPVAVWAWNAFMAAICGDTVVWKPSPKAPLCALAVQKICERVLQRVGCPQIFSVLISDDNELTTKLAADARFPLVSFTGSTAVGRKINEIVAQRLGKSLLELGGNNAMIVDETAELKLAIPAILFGAVGTAGQRCTTLRRLFVHHSRCDEVTKKLCQAYQQIKIGDPLQDHVLMGPLIDQAAVEKYCIAVQEVQKQGGTILHGGKVLGGTGYFVEPTLVKAQAHWAIVQQETFSPILYIISYHELSQAIEWQNSVSYGLSSALFTQNLLHAERFLSVEGSDCGIANINIGTSGAEIGGAFGGEKDTGGGREAGSDAWKAYMRRQTNTINWGQSLPLSQGIKFEIDS